MNIIYVAHGSVRGNCGHKHRTIDAAEACCERDASQCLSLGGGAYSDRSVMAVEDGYRRPLTEEEAECLIQYK